MRLRLRRNDGRSRQRNCARHKVGRFTGRLCMSLVRCRQRSIQQGRIKTKALSFVMNLTLLFSGVCNYSSLFTIISSIYGLSLQSLSVRYNKPLTRKFILFSERNFLDTTIKLLRYLKWIKVWESETKRRFICSKNMQKNRDCGIIYTDHKGGRKHG